MMRQFDDISLEKAKEFAIGKVEALDEKISYELNEVKTNFKKEFND